MDPEGLASGLFFIVGAPRSGTTLVQSALSAHPRLHVPPETEFFLKFDSPPDPGAPAREWDEYFGRWFSSDAWTDQGLSEREFREAALATDRSARSIFLALMRTHAERAGKPRIGEKSPHHCRRVRRILRAFPDARFIHVVRDPRDVVASRLNVPWTRQSAIGLARSWCGIIREHERLAAELPEERYTSVRYEDFVSDPEPSARRLCAFLGEDYDPAVLADRDRVGGTHASREAAWKDNVRNPITRASVGRFRSALTPRQVRGVERTLGPLLDRYVGPPEQPSDRPLWLLADAADRARDRAGSLSRSVAKRLGRGA